MEAIAMMYELGFKEPEDYFETPGTWLTFDFDNHPGMVIIIIILGNWNYDIYSWINYRDSN